VGAANKPCAQTESVMNPTEMHRVCERLIVYLETGEAATDLFTEDEERWSDAKGDWDQPRQEAHAAQVSLLEA
jgi:hypothetical protein